MKKFIPDCFWPSSKNGEYVSHEAVCILNDGADPVNVTLTLYFEDREKMTGFSFVVGAERTLHIRMDKIANDKEEKVPVDTPYAVVVEADKDVAVQYTRVDTTQSQLALMTTAV
ncbi:MAG: sensory rhodopsin transducer [Oscillospiraceae bacterium]